MSSPSLHGVSLIDHGAQTLSGDVVALEGNEIRLACERELTGRALESLCESAPALAINVVTRGLDWTRRDCLVAAAVLGHEAACLLRQLERPARTEHGAICLGELSRTALVLAHEAAHYGRLAIAIR